MARKRLIYEDDKKNYFRFFKQESREGAGELTTVYEI